MGEGSACFEDLSAAAIRQGLDVKGRIFGKGACLLRQGEAPAGLFLIRSGLARVSALSANGHEILFGFVGPGEIIGEIEYFAEEPITCTVEAVERTEASFIPIAAVGALLETEPQLGLGLARVMARRYYRDVQRSSARITYPVAHNVLRICLALMTSPGARLLKRDLAEYLATSERHLNRVLKDLAARGALETGPGEVRRIHAAVARSLMKETR